MWARTRLINNRHRHQLNQPAPFSRVNVGNPRLAADRCGSFDFRFDSCAAHHPSLALRASFGWQGPAPCSTHGLFSPRASPTSAKDGVLRSAKREGGPIKAAKLQRPGHACAAVRVHHQQRERPRLVLHGADVPREVAPRASQQRAQPTHRDRRAVEARRGRRLRKREAGEGVRAISEIRVWLCVRRAALPVNLHRPAARLLLGCAGPGRSRRAIASTRPHTRHMMVDR
jgi:hypothetical protein